LLVLSLVAACGGKRAACPALPVVAQGPAFLWKVHKANGPTLWLFGTIHDIGLAGVPPQVLAALDGAGVFASELGQDAPLPDNFYELSHYASGPGIDQQLSSDDWYDLRDTLLGTVKEDDLRRMRPWLAMIKLNNKVSPGKPAAMDGELGKRAQQHRVPVEALETWAQQIAALDKAVTVPDLADVIHARNAMHCEVDRLAVAYRTGDLDVMTQLLVVPRTADVLLWSRNRAWLPELEGYLAAKGAFVAVGLGHMLGEHGLPALLAADGFTVERVP
jgi:hypothetical protein